MSSASTSALLYAASISYPQIQSPRPDDEITQSKAWHNPSKGVFENPWPSFQVSNFWTIIGRMLLRKLKGEMNSPDTTPPTVPVQTPKFLPSRQQSDKLRATWLGHACYLVEFPSGLRVLFDPVFEDRCSPFTWLGPKRYTPVPCQIADIPMIDAVIISHSHYDHLSSPTVTEISKRHPNAHFFVPLGNKEWFNESGIHQVTEMDWWDEVDFTLTPQNEKPIVTPTDSSSSPPSQSQTQPSATSQPIRTRISCLPSQHVSNRGIFDRNKTLWASWAVRSTDHNPKSVYFAGDTGYRSVPRTLDLPNTDDWSDTTLPICPAFQYIGNLRGPFDLGLIPIGAYTPRWIMSPVHANPRDAVEIFRDTKCKRALGMHWGTWVLTEEDVLEPPKLLKDALGVVGLQREGVFDICEIGESTEV